MLNQSENLFIITKLIRIKIYWKNFLLDKYIDNCLS